MRSQWREKLMQVVMFGLGVVAGGGLHREPMPVLPDTPIEIRADASGGDVAEAYMRLLARQLGGNEDFAGLVRDHSRSGAELQQEWIKRSQSAHAAAAEVVDAALESRIRSGDRDALAEWINQGVQRWKQMGR